MPGLKGILKDVEEGTLVITDEYEDIHSFVEANLIDRIGDAGKKLHTGRSRNDQVALDMKLYTRDEIAGSWMSLLKELLEVLLKMMKEHTGHIYAGIYPSCRRHSRLRWHIIWALILRCLSGIAQRLKDIYERMNYCPLGSGALAGTTYPLDREYTAELLGF